MGLVQIYHRKGTPYTSTGMWKSRILSTLWIDFLENMNLISKHQKRTILCLCISTSADRSKGHIILGKITRYNRYVTIGLVPTMRGNL